MSIYFSENRTSLLNSSFSAASEYLICGCFLKKSSSP